MPPKLKELAADIRAGFRKHKEWHPVRLRFGPNRDGTCCGLGAAIGYRADSTISAAADKYKMTENEAWSFVSGWDAESWSAYRPHYDAECFALGKRLARELIDGIKEK